MFFTRKRNLYESPCIFIPVSYTHLDVYKRQVQLNLPVSAYCIPSTNVFGAVKFFQDFFDLARGSPIVYNHFLHYVSMSVIYLSLNL